MMATQEVVAWSLATPVQFFVAMRFYRNAWRGLLHRRFGMDLLVALGTSIAYLASVLSALGVLSGGSSLFECSSLLVTFVLLGKYLEALAKAKTTEALLVLMDMQPRKIKHPVSTPCHHMRNCCSECRPTRGVMAMWCWFVGR